MKESINTIYISTKKTQSPYIKNNQIYRNKSYESNLFLINDNKIITKSTPIILTILDNIKTNNIVLLISLTISEYGLKDFKTLGIFDEIHKKCDFRFENKNGNFVFLNENQMIIQIFDLDGKQVLHSTLIK